MKFLTAILLCLMCTACSAILPLGQDGRYCALAIECRYHPPVPDYYHVIRTQPHLGK
jgi:hypothetical protein